MRAAGGGSLALQAHIPGFRVQGSGVQGSIGSRVYMVQGVKTASLVLGVL